MDIIERGDIIDLEPKFPANHFLPEDITINEGVLLECPQSQDKVINGEPALPMRELGVDESYTDFEKKLIGHLNSKRRAAMKFRKDLETATYRSRMFDFEIPALEEVSDIGSINEMIAELNGGADEGEDEDMDVDLEFDAEEGGVKLG
jgi:hypothetical protein